MHLPKPRMIPGLSFSTHKWHFLAWAYAAGGFALTWSLRKAEKAAEEQEYVSFYREAGSYKHPWEHASQPYNDPRAVEKLRGKDYTKVISMPAGSLSHY